MKKSVVGCIICLITGFSLEASRLPMCCATKLLLSSGIAIRGGNVDKKSEIKWADEISKATIRSSLKMWERRYKKYRPELKQLSKEEREKKFLRALERGTYELLSYKDVLALSMDYMPLTKRPQATTPEEAYPETELHNGKKRKRDIAKVRCFMEETSRKISPVCVGRIKQGPNTTYYKLDGAHRIVAAVFRKSKIRVLFVDL